MSEWLTVWISACLLNNELVVHYKKNLVTRYKYLVTHWKQSCWTNRVLSIFHAKRYCKVQITPSDWSLRTNNGFQRFQKLICVKSFSHLKTCTGMIRDWHASSHCGIAKICYLKSHCKTPLQLPGQLSSQYLAKEVVQELMPNSSSSSSLVHVVIKSCNWSTLLAHSLLTLLSCSACWWWESPALQFAITWPMC